MLQSVTTVARAKINLGLRVYPRRADGYHDIASVFSTVNLGDSLTVRPLAQKDTCRVVCRGMNLPEQNTFTLTYKAFCVLTGLRDGVEVEVTKHIPSGGGLGGGSSDSSSFLQSIDILFGTHLGEAALQSVAAQVGSDVFFFTKALWCAGAEKTDGSQFAALVSGRGEKVEPIASARNFTVLLVFPGVSVSTKEAYALIDGRLCRSADEGSVPEMERECENLLMMYRKPVQEWFFVNDFTALVAGRYPKIGQALLDVRNSGALFADMSGSGSTVFGIFEDKKLAQKACDQLSGRWSTVLA